MTTPPEISVIVPVYNTADWLPRCLESLQNQDAKAFEIIVVDDGSTDGSGRIAESFVAQDNRFRLIRTENRGLSAARNIGLEYCRGDYVGFVDSDDHVHPSYLSEMRVAMAETGADWACCPVELEYLEGGNCQVDVHSAIHSQPEYKQDQKTALISFDSWLQVIDHWPSAWNKLYRRSLISDVRFEEGLSYEDHIFFLQLARRSPTIARVKTPLYRWQRGRLGQITSDGGDRVFEQFRVLDLIRQTLEQGGFQAVPALKDADEAFERSAGRLLYERERVILDIQRKDRFHRACRDYFSANGLSFNPGGDSFVPSIWGISVSNPTAISFILIATEDTEGIKESLRAIEQQNLPDYELVIISNTSIEAAVEGETKFIMSDDGLATALYRALGMVQGQYVTIVNAGDRPDPDGFARSVTKLWKSGAYVGLCVDCTPSVDAAAPEPMMEEEHLLSIDPPLPAMVFHRDLVKTLPAGLRRSCVEVESIGFALAARGLPGLLLALPFVPSAPAPGQGKEPCRSWRLKSYLSGVLNPGVSLENRLRLKLMLWGVWKTTEAAETSKVVKSLLFLQTRILFWWIGFRDISIATSDMSEGFLHKVDLHKVDETH